MPAKTVAIQLFQYLQTMIKHKKLDDNNLTHHILCHFLEQQQCERVLQCDMYIVKLVAKG